VAERFDLDKCAQNYSNPFNSCYSLGCGVATSAYTAGFEASSVYCGGSSPATVTAGATTAAGTAANTGAQGSQPSATQSVASHTSAGGAAMTKLAEEVFVVAVAGLVGALVV